MILKTNKDIRFSHARTAFKYSLKILELQPNDVVLIPDFICESILHPLYGLGLEPNFYGINDDMTPQWDDVESLVNSQTKAILMVHYFGQPQDIKKFKAFCSKYNLFLIEDNAHGHGGKYNQQLLGSFGHVGFSSPRKILESLFCGGVLFINQDDYNIDLLPDLPGYSVKMSKRLMKAFTYYFPNLKHYCKKLLKKRPLYENPREFIEPILKDYLMDLSSKIVYEKSDWFEIQKKRQKQYHNWELFAKNNGLKPVFKRLHPEACPWVFAAYLNKGQQNKTWFDWGWENNCQVISWPALPEEIIKRNTSAMKRWNKLICFQITH